MSPLFFPTQTFYLKHSILWFFTYY